MDSNYKKAFTELYEILKRLKKEDLDKIPIEVIDAIKDNRDLEYEFRIDDGIDITENKFLPETRSIVLFLLRKYIADKKQKAIIEDIINNISRIEENTKKEQYDTDVFKTKRKNDT